MDAVGHLSRLTFICLAIALLSLLPASAQDDNTLPLFTPVAGTLANGQTARWTFAATDGAMLSFVARAISGDLDPIITIESSTGTVILQNDDFNYPASSAALLEGVTIPHTGTFTLTVSGFGDTSGDYELAMLPGFATIARQEPFDDPTRWTTTSAVVKPVFGNNRMALILAGLQERAFMTYQADIGQTEYYIHVAVPEISGSADWQVGLVARQQNVQTYYLYALDNRGQWRFSANTADGESTIRDWSAHPALIPGETAFTISLLVRGTGFDFFYNGQLIGRLADDTIAGPGQIGLMTGISAVATSEITAQFENLTVTIPLEDGDFIPTQIEASDPTVTLQELQRRRLIPASGQMALIVPESFVTFNRPGVNQIQLGGDETFTNFALGATVTWEIFTPDLPAGCGLTLRATGDDNYLLAYFDQTGAAGLSQRRGTTFEPGVFREGLETSTGPHRLLIVADDDRLLYYVNGQLVGTLSDEAIAGAVGNAAMNFEPTTTSCQFTDTWVWAWK